MASTADIRELNLDAPSAAPSHIDAEPPPFRRLQATQVQLIPALVAGSVAAGAFLTAYYATLGLLPRAFPGAYADYPLVAWADRFDISQVTGTFVHPPYPSLLNWFLGLFLLGGGLASLGIVYAILLSWILEVSSAPKGACFGGAIFLAVGVSLWGANGVVTPIMRNALPDPGFMFLGWTGWAGIQMFACWTLYGLVLGAVYRAVQYRNLTRQAGKV